MDGQPESALPVAANLEWLRKEAKGRLRELRQENPRARLADAQYELARQHGFRSWRALKAHVDSLGPEGRVFEAAATGDVAATAALIDDDPELLRARRRPYGTTLLHVAAQNGQTKVVELLIERGFDVNVRDEGDNASPMHWAAAGGHLDVVRRLADAGGDVIGDGDDHELQVIGWATCFVGDEERQGAVADFLVGRGAQHHVFSALALGLSEEVRRIVAADPTTLTKAMSRHENGQLPLHFAVRRNRADMVALLLELGADPGATDDYGASASTYAAAPEVGPAVVEALAKHSAIDIVGALVLGDEETAARLLEGARDRAWVNSGVLHRLAKRGDSRSVQWLLERGADANATWSHWDAEVTPLHLAAAQGHVEVVRILLAAGADPSIRDSKHDGNAFGWAEHGRIPPAPRRDEVLAILEAHAASHER